MRLLTHSKAGIFRFLKAKRAFSACLGIWTVVSVGCAADPAYDLPPPRISNVALCAQPADLPIDVLVVVDGDERGRAQRDEIARALPAMVRELGAAQGAVTSDVRVLVRETEYGFGPFRLISALLVTPNEETGMRAGSLLAIVIASLTDDPLGAADTRDRLLRRRGGPVVVMTIVGEAAEEVSPGALRRGGSVPRWDVVLSGNRQSADETGTRAAGSETLFRYAGSCDGFVGSAIDAPHLRAFASRFGSRGRTASACAEDYGVALLEFASMVSGVRCER